MNQKFKKVTALSLTYLTVLFLCVCPFKLPEKPTEQEISICCGDDEPVELPLDPDDPKPH